MSSSSATANNKLNELSSLIENLQEYALLCRPSDVISFTVQFIEDSQRELAQTNGPFSTLKLPLHSLHSLRFIIRQSGPFREAACGIYSALIAYQQQGSNYEVDSDDHVAHDLLFDILKTIRLRENWITSIATEEVRIII